ncbi:hypothetical protein N0V83_009198 [Neocucurbitaria cava]|uniref:Uncharacterized protein n=1 Tax=Neocucurbitaria cava TaxID=798079 RepID=A0A9W8Y127_9PLEO|nr:hypothetical protein N0V83_009198 [Neocucurbitaria cava]
MVGAPEQLLLDFLKDDLVQCSSHLRPLADAIFRYTESVRTESPPDPSNGVNLSFFLPGARLADEWIEIFLTTPDRYLKMAPLAVRWSFESQQYSCQTATTSFEGWMKESAREPESLGIEIIASEIVAAERVAAERSITEWITAERSETARIDAKGNDAEVAASEQQMPFVTHSATGKRKERDDTGYEAPQAEDDEIASVGAHTASVQSTDAAIVQSADAASLQSEDTASVQYTDAASVQSADAAQSQSAVTIVTDVNVFIASVPNRASRRHIGRGNKRFAMSHGHIRAYVEFLGQSMIQLPSHANSEYGHEMKSFATPETVDLTLLRVPVTSQEIMTFTPYSTVIHEVAERLHRSWTPSDMANYMNWARDLTYENSYHRTMFSHQYNHTRIDARHRIANVPSRMSRRSQLDQNSKKAFHDYYLWDMGEGVHRYPEGRAAQLLTHVIRHVRLVTNDRDVRLSQLEEYAAKHQITVPVADQLQPNNDCVEEDKPSEAFLADIDAEFRRKFDKSSTKV